MLVTTAPMERPPLWLIHAPSATTARRGHLTRSSVPRVTTRTSLAGMTVNCVHQDTTVITVMAGSSSTILSSVHLDTAARRALSAQTSIRVHWARLVMVPGTMIVRTVFHVWEGSSAELQGVQNPPGLALRVFIVEYMSNHPLQIKELMATSVLKVKFYVHYFFNFYFILIFDLVIFDMCEYSINR